MKKLIVKSPAKINLYLKILNKFTDGYHEIDTAFQLIDLFDEIEFINSKNNVSVNSNLNNLNDDKNIISIVAKRLKKTNKKLGVDIKLDKKIPIGGGLGGGSSNAASTIIALNKLWNLGMTKIEMHNFAKSIGADVPFFLFGKNAYAKGIGDVLKFKESISGNILIIDPKIFSSSKKMYKKFDELKFYKNHKSKNDFLEIYLNENNEVADFYNKNKENFEINLSGSGSCFFINYNNNENIKKFIKKIPSYWRFFACKPLQYSPICNIN